MLRRIPEFGLARRTGWPRMLPVSVTLVPSSHCNSRCLTCRAWQKHEEQLALDEWERVLHSLGRAPYWFTISGGEPFLYRDLVALCRAVYEHCRPAIINIPTNCLLAATIPAKVAQICGACPEAQIIVNLSLDGIGEQHDIIRGVPGNFEKFETTFRALRGLGCRNLTLGIHSVISRFNVDAAPELFDYALSLKPDSYITEIAEQRVELGTMDMDITPAPDRYVYAIEQLIARVKERRFAGISKVTEAFRVQYYRLVERVLVEQTQVIPCYAGWASAQISAAGEVWPCCVRADNLGNLRDVDYDFGRVWFSSEADRVRTDIRRRECHCPLANASYTNMLMHVPTLARVSTRVALQSLPGPRRSSGRPLPDRPLIAKP